MTELTQNQEAEEGKRSAYPYATFPTTLEIAAKVKELGGSNHEIKKSVLAHSFGVSDKSPSLIQNIASAKAFGLIHGRGSFRLTETAQKYFFPTSEGERQRAILHAIKTPLIFESLIDRFDGQKVPDAATLVNILHRDYHVTVSWQRRVAALFISTIREAKIVDASGILRYQSSLHTAGNGILGGMSSPTTSSSPTPVPADRLPPAYESLVAMEPVKAGVAGWTYRGIRVEVPENLTFELWKKLIDYVNVLKPDEKSTTV
ncbi:MAG TPA: hypothetical protein VG269_28500 [Tepidisphaeraceae bacterium]|jgi:hypothetical protein|nr:hypothetical protein [Tepidisphaeraceae bacterium]